MSDTIKGVTFGLGARDETKPALDSFQRNTKKAATNAGNSVNYMFGEKAKKSASAFNEKTEKGRQLLTALGSAAGASGAGGQVLYYAGTVGALSTALSPMSLAIMAATAAVGALGWAFLQTSQNAKELERRAKEFKKEGEGWIAYNKRVNEEIQKIRDKLAGADTAEKLELERMKRKSASIAGIIATDKDLVKELKEKIKTTQKEIDEKEASLAYMGTKHAHMATAAERSKLKDYRKRIKEADDRAKQQEARKAGLDSQTSALGKNIIVLEKTRKEEAAASKARIDEQNAKQKAIADQIKRAQEEAKRLQDSNVGAEPIVLATYKRSFDSEAILAEHRKRSEQQKEARERELAEVISFEKRKQDIIDELQEESNRKAEEAAQKRAQVQAEYAQMGADAIVGIAQAIMDAQGQSVWAAVHEQLKAYAYQSSLEALRMLAYAAGMFAFGQGPQAALALKSAGMHAAFAAAAGAGAIATSGASGGASVPSSSERSSYQGRDRDQQAQGGGGVTLVIQGNIYGGRSGAKEIRDELQKLEYHENPGMKRRQVA